MQQQQQQTTASHLHRASAASAAAGQDVAATSMGGSAPPPPAVANFCLFLDLMADVSYDSLKLFTYSKEALLESASPQHRAALARMRADLDAVGRDIIWRLVREKERHEQILRRFGGGGGGGAAGGGDLAAASAAAVAAASGFHASAQAAVFGTPIHTALLTSLHRLHGRLESEVAGTSFILLLSFSFSPSLCSLS
jgi:hypothetical protein